jgi:hypothetical protein
VKTSVFFKGGSRIRARAPWAVGLSYTRLVSSSLNRRLRAVIGLGLQIAVRNSDHHNNTCSGGDLSLKLGGPIWGDNMRPQKIDDLNGIRKWYQI